MQQNNRTIVRFLLRFYWEMKFTKEIILEEAFKLFLKKGYSEVSISVVQKELGIGRATLYYYFKNKEDLFKTVVDHYIIKYLNSSLNIEPSVTLPDMIESRIRLIIEQRDLLLNSNNPNLTFFNLSSIKYIALLKYEDYRQQIEIIRTKSLELWRTAIRNSIKNNEIRDDVNIDVLAEMFVNVKVSYETNYNNLIKVKDGSFIQAYFYLYELIKETP